MPTRFYMPFDQPALSVTVTKHATWESESVDVIRQPLVTSVPAVTDPDGRRAFTVSEADPAIHDQLCAQFISSPLASQEISGTVTGIWSTREAASTYDFGTQLCIRIVSYDGSVVRHTLYDPHNYAGVSSTPGNTNREFASGASHETRFLPGGAGALTTGWAFNGDRLVVEVGARATNLIATTRTADPRIYCRIDFADAPLTEGLTATNLNSWIELSSILTFNPSYSPTQFIGWGTPVI